MFLLLFLILICYIKKNFPHNAHRKNSGTAAVQFQIKTVVDSSLSATQNREKQNWWGWGDSQKTYDLNRRPYFWPYLRRKLPFPQKPFFFPPDWRKIKIPPPALSPSARQRLEEIVRPGQIDSTPQTRISHVFGKSYHDLIRIRTRNFAEFPDAVVFPENEEQILALLRWARDENSAVVPWGGGTSVVGGVEARTALGQNSLLVLDLRHMNRVLEVNQTSLVAEAEAGILGPELEAHLQARGVTLSHYPESFEFSTLGGWVATRSAGQQSTLYGKIEDMVESLRLVTPDGILCTPRFPAAALGPDLAQTVVGSEGILGVISRVRVRVKPIPAKKLYTAFLFHSFEEGLRAVRELLQSGLSPATVRLSDAEETDFIFALREKKNNFSKARMEAFGFWLLEKKGFSSGKRSILILGLEGTEKGVRQDWQGLKKILKKYRAFHLGKSTGQAWYQHRFENPYLRDILMDYDLLVDTLETATEWDNVWALYEAGRRGIEDAFSRLKISGVVTVHASHVYATGASLYFIILAVPHPGKELEEWWSIKQSASDALVNAGGAISHHHGIGLDHRPWLEKNIGKQGVALLRKLKQNIDPDDILNPGKLLPEQ